MSKTVETPVMGIKIGNCVLIVSFANRCCLDINKKTLQVHFALGEYFLLVC